MARARMMVLYDHSVTWGGLVIGTGNKTETLIGYSTLWGDSASAFNPIGDLYKSQIRQLSAAMGVPDAVIRKAPSADLWPGQTDEAEVGFSYAEVDRILFRLVDRRLSLDEIVADGFERELVERVDRMVAGSEFKRQVPPIANARLTNRSLRSVARATSLVSPGSTTKETVGRVNRFSVSDAAYRGSSTTSRGTRSRSRRSRSRSAKTPQRAGSWSSSAATGPPAPASTPTASWTRVSPIPTTTTATTTA